MDPMATRTARGRMLRAGMLRAGAACLLMVTAAGCADQKASTSPTVTAATATTSPPVATVAPTPALTARPTLAASEDAITETFDYANFTNSTKVDNRWLPLTPGTQWTWDGFATIDGERLPRRVITAVTDLTKVIDGVRVVVAFDQDITDGVLEEAELAFYAQDDDGNVWRMGEYPEEYEDGAFTAAPTWLAGADDAKAGIMVQADPDEGTPSYSQGWGPKVDWTDRARVLEVASETCVPFACYKDVLVTNEFNRDSPDAHQLKYYAPGVGNVRTGWAGALEEEQEVLELTAYVHLSGDALAAVRAKALALEAHAYTVSPDVYGKTTPAERGPG